MPLDARQIPSEAHWTKVPTDEQISIVDIANAVLRRRWLVVGTAAAFALATLGYLLIAPRTYSVQSSFIIQKRDATPAAGLAAQLGMDVSGADANESPAFYAALVKTPDVLDHIVDSTFTTSSNTAPRTLAKIWNVKAKSREAEREAVIEKLQAAVSSNVSQKLDLVTLTVKTDDAQLSKQLTDAILQQINWFNLKSRQSRAAAERQFDERLVQEVGGDLRAAEDAAQQFMQANQQPHMSAALEMEKQRLSRRLEILNARYISVVTAYDHARIDEVRDTPVITEIQRPRMPVRADSRRIPQKTGLMLLLGLFVGLVAAVATQVFSASRSSSTSDIREFRRLWDETSHDVTRLWRGVRHRSEPDIQSPADLT